MILIFKSIFLGLGVAMDAFTIAMSNGLKYKEINKKKTLLIAFMFAIFQGIMPLIGYFIGYCALKPLLCYSAPISFFILCFLGIKTILDCFNKGKDDKTSNNKLAFKTIIIQAIATSIDALSIGITLINYSIIQTLICVFIISIITFFVCLLGVFIGKKFGIWMKNYAELFGGLILIIIGISNII